MDSHFDDPALKAALKRALGGETAPPGLRARVEKMLAAEAASPLVRPKQRFDWRRSPLVGLAAAAMIIVSTAFVLNYYRQAEPSSLATLPNDLASEMTAAHDAAMAQASHHNLPVPKDDLDKIRQTLKDRLGHPVLVASLGADWKLEGASVTKVGERDAAQLVYSKGNESVSVISVSIAGRGYVPSEGTDYMQTWEGHPLAGVVKGGAVHCVIGSKGTKLSENFLARLRDKISGLIASGKAVGDTCGGDAPLPARM